jgi:FkbM family methyltransferase
MNYEHTPGLDVIQSYFDPDYIGTCIDVGASDGYHGNMTQMFELKGWETLCIEPNPVYYNHCSMIRKTTSMYAVGATDENGITFTVFDVGGGNLSAISGLSTEQRLVESHKHLITNTYDIMVNVRTLDTIIEEVFSFVDVIDFVSIDTEGTELDVLRGFDIEYWKPKLFVIENNFDEPYLAEYLETFGYVRDKREHVNDFFVRRDF